MHYPLTAIVSDLHSNLQALETALADARARGARRYVCLGDIIGYGARPAECVALVRRLCVPGARDPVSGERLEDGLCLLGNHEDALLRASAEDFNVKARAAIEWTRSALNVPLEADAHADNWDFLDGLSPSAADEVAMFAHGSPREPVREYLLPRDAADRTKMQACFNKMERTICFVGHSHVPALYREDGQPVRLPRYENGLERVDLAGAGRVIVNVGSVGQPRDGDPRLSYVLFDGEAVTFVRLEYDHASAAAEIRTVPELPDFLADRLAVGR